MNCLELFLLSSDTDDDGVTEWNRTGLLSNCGWRCSKGAESVIPAPLHITSSASQWVNNKCLTKVGTQTEILTQPRKHDKHKSEINIKTANIILLNYQV